MACTLMSQKCVRMRKMYKSAKFCVRLIPTAICNSCTAVIASQPSDSTLVQYVELHIWVIKKVRGLHYLKPNQ